MPNEAQLAWASYDAATDVQDRLEALRIVARLSLEQRLQTEALQLQLKPTIKGYATLLRSWRYLGTSWPEAIRRSGVGHQLGEALQHNKHREAQRLLDERLQGDV